MVRGGGKASKRKTKKTGLTPLREAVPINRGLTPLREAVFTKLRVDGIEGGNIR